MGAARTLRYVVFDELSERGAGGVPSPLAGEGYSAAQQQDRVRARRAPSSNRAGWNARVAFSRKGEGTSWSAE